MNFLIAPTGYAAAAVAFAVLSGLLLTTWRKRVRGSLLTLACLTVMVWAVALVWASIRPTVSSSQILLIEMAHDFVWLLCLSSLLGGAVAVESNWLVRRGGVVLGGVLLAAALLLEFTGLRTSFAIATAQLLVMGSIATSLYALVGIEQLYRNARPTQQNGLKFLCLGLAGIFAYDLFLYSNAVADGQIRPAFWSARGFVVALCVPLIAVSVRRIPAWKRGIFASRQIVFYSTTLFAAGIYLTLIGFAGYYIRTLGRDWGDALQLIFFSAAVLGFFVLVMSEQLRARGRVWLAKHFFERKYDYRAEWLRLISTLTAAEDGLPLKKRAIKALAQIVDSHSGVLWLEDSGGETLTAVAGWNVSTDSVVIPTDAVLASFLGSKGWIIDVSELGSAPARYEPLRIDDLPESSRDAAFIIPLFHDERLMGFVALAKPRTEFTLNFEDHDLFKTAGQQIASYLAQEQATERLAESMQFEAYNRFTAFVMHDLKNAIAQQSLVVENAAKHKDNPEFIDDAIETIKGSVERMRRVLSHLRQSSMEQPAETVDLTRILMRVESQCSDRAPEPVMRIPDRAVSVRANKDRIAAAINHAVRNAQDACEARDEVSVELKVDGSFCRVEIRDTGCGMDEEFVRDRLFRPFDSTKGAEGMGIGAYQVRETLRAIGGDVEVVSAVGEGTTLVMTLPIVRSTES